MAMIKIRQTSLWCLCDICCVRGCRVVIRSLLIVGVVVNFLSCVVNCQGSRCVVVKSCVSSKVNHDKYPRYIVFKDTNVVKVCDQGQVFSACVVVSAFYNKHRTNKQRNMAAHNWTSTSQPASKV